MRVIRQRSTRDCALCCYAMALGLSYEEAAADLPAVHLRPLHGPDFAQAFARRGYDLSYSARWFAPQRPAIIACGLRRAPKGVEVATQHAVYFDGQGRVIDPSPSPVFRDLTSALGAAVGWWQWWPRGERPAETVEMYRTRA